MELRQLRYFVRVVELGSMSRAALDLQLVQSALSQQIGRLEGELSTRLLQSRLSGSVSVGLAPTTASVLGLPLMLAVRERSPGVRLHMVESLSGHLAGMLNARQLDLAVRFDTDPGRRWSVMPLAEKKTVPLPQLRRVPARMPVRPTA